MPLRIVLANTHGVLRQSLKALLAREGLEVVGEASDVHEAVRLAQCLHPDVALLDLTVPPLNGIAAAREILRDSPQTRTMLLSKLTALAYVLEALRAGVRGYVTQSEATGGILTAIRDVAAGKLYLSPAISDAVVEAFLSKSGLTPEALSSRQVQVLRLLGEGKSAEEIAALLGISLKTVATHRYRIMAKLDMHDTASLVRHATRRGLIRP